MVHKSCTKTYDKPEKLMNRPLIHSVLFVLYFFFLLPHHSPQAWADLPENINLVPHKALYDLKLSSTKSGSPLVNLSGKMFYEWQPDCDGWLSSHRFDLQYEYADSPAVRITNNFSTYETLDGQNMHFSVVKKRDGILFQELRGHANLRKNQGDAVNGEAVYTIPTSLTFDLPPNTVLPMGHTLGVLEHIKNGKTVYNSTIFDGSDENGPVEINAIIGQPKVLSDIDLGNEEIDYALLEGPVSPINLAFFPLSENLTIPEYEMSITFHHNGIISDMLITYDNFSVRQNLVALEKLETACPGKDK